MKTTNNFYYMMLIMIFLCAFMYCSGDGTPNIDSNTSDTTVRIDTVSATTHDPTSAFPQPPVTGNQTDSSRTLDSAKGNKH